MSTQLRPRRYRAGQPISATDLNRLAESAIQRFSIPGGTIRRMGTSSAITVPRNSPTISPFPAVLLGSNNADGEPGDEHYWAEIGWFDGQWDYVKDGRTHQLGIGRAFNGGYCCPPGHLVWMHYIGQMEIHGIYFFDPPASWLGLITSCLSSGWASVVPIFDWDPENQTYKRLDMDYGWDPVLPSVIWAGEWPWHREDDIVLVSYAPKMLFGLQCSYQIEQLIPGLGLFEPPSGTVTNWDDDRNLAPDQDDPDVDPAACGE